ncbi:flagellin [Methanosarcina sp. DH2]|uniref:archaellin/type IV pilin N-terminal domain-containing protein n=1 Tax=Methanosarcina sp. DH2 TaxID=2605639 RepID=UPI001E2B000E|nr:archaellin/type IV pilin N-terminal domain-containing protein [Methanosarcina sp. DH2]MCC4771721.1 flagellin [Methanosarcina sp. DH2]
MWNRLIKDEKGFTGLEAAIVLVAFVVVAAVFSYVMLGAGFYTTQKSQEVVHTGVTQASSSIAPSGDIIVKGAAASKASQITFYVTNTAGGTAVDLDKTILTYTDDDDFVTKEYVADNSPADPLPDIKGPVAAIPADWTITNGWVYQTVIATNEDNLLEKGEKYKVVIDLTQLISTSTEKTLPTVNEQFKIELKPPEGAVLTLSRTLPAALIADNYYPVY